MFIFLSITNYLIFTSGNKYPGSLSRANEIYSWTSKAMSEKSIKNPSTSGNCVARKWIDGYKLPKIKFNGNCVKQDVVTLLHKNVGNLYITYKLDVW